VRAAELGTSWECELELEQKSGRNELKTELLLVLDLLAMAARSISRASSLQRIAKRGLIASTIISRSSLRNQIRAQSTSTSSSPFTESTSPNPTATTHAETTPALHQYGSYLMQCLTKYVQQFSVVKDELTLYICPSGVVPVMTFLRDHSQCRFKQVMQITACDFPERDKRFEIVYHLLSVEHAARIRVKTYANEVDAVPSISGLFNGANW
jgi:NADH dehydrogenase (ubiquinone) Fe-S protein 3